MSENEPDSILVVTPHPDDSESAAGGTIAKWCAEGKKVVLVVCTNGDKGTSDRSIKPEDLAATRELETLNAAKAYGLAGVEFLRLKDQGLEDNDEFREKLVRQIRIHKPRLLLTIDPYRNYIRHRDHSMTGRVALDAVFPLHAIMEPILSILLPASSRTRFRRSGYLDPKSPITMLM